MSSTDPRPIKVVAFDIDGTLTDATTWYGGDALGWMQSYSVRDGEALLRLVKRGVIVLPVSRNQTSSARRRMEGLSFDTRFLGVANKLDALEALCRDFEVDVAEVCFVGDGIDDAPVLRRVGLGAAVSDAHPEAKTSADLVLESKGGARVIEELEHYLERTGRVSALQIDRA